MAAIVMVLVTGCSTTTDSDATSTASTTQSSEPSATTTTTAAPAAIEQFTGAVDGFYVVPHPLPPAPPGALIRVQAVNADGSGVTSRIMYHSLDAQGDDRAVTAIVTTPVGTAPASGWPVIATAPGTVGLAPPCALSRNGTPAPAFGVAGVGVITDYIGTGPVGELQPYLSRLSEGHSVLDAARAARLLVGSDAGTDLLIFGHSQGGHGALAAHELAATYAPEFHLLGTVAAAPAAMFDRTYGEAGGIDEIVSRIVTTMSLFGLATEQPELHPADYLTPAAMAVTGVMTTGCLQEITDALVPLAAAAPYWRADPRTTEPARSILLANDVGNVAADAPLLLISGTADARVVHARTLDLYRRLCGTGQRTQLLVLDGADHGTEIPIAMDRIVAWYGQRLAAASPIDDCASDPTGGS